MLGQVLRAYRRGRCIYPKNEEGVAWFVKSATFAAVKNQNYNLLQALYYFLKLIREDFDACYLIVFIDASESFAEDPYQRALHYLHDRVCYHQGSFSSFDLFILWIDCLLQPSFHFTVI